MLGPTVDALAGAHRVVPQSTDRSDPPNRTQTFTVKLGSWTYPLAWIGIYGLHVACTGYCFAAALLFQTISTSNTAYFLDFYQVTLPSKYSRKVALAHYIVGGIHCWFLASATLRFLFRAVRYIIWRCKHGAVVQPAPRTSTATSSMLGRVTSAIPQTLERSIPWLLRTPFQLLFKHVFGRTGVFGVEFRYFDAFFLIREIVETALQSFQAYQMCRLLARPALNRFFVVTLVINCWATPVLHHFIPSRPLQRLLTRLCDVMLDFVASVGVPLILTMAYVPLFDTTIKDFPYELWYDDKWFVNLLKESPIVLFGSWLDALSRLVFSLSLLTSLDDIKLLLKRGPGITMNTLRRLSTWKARKSRKPTVTPTWVTEKESRTITRAHRFMFAYGFVILGVHLYAELRPSPMESCLLAVRPWLVSQPACSLVEINCWRDRTLTGNANDFARHIDDLDALSLTQITFRHCPRIEMQPSLEHFENMIGIKFYNSTLASWRDDAALRERLHTKMRFVFCVRTTFANASLPAGLLSHEFPTYLNDVEFSVTNLQYIPDDLDKRWPPGVALCLEFSELTTYPLTFSRAQFQSLTLAGNKITSLPAALFEAPGTFMVGVTGNPISELPADVNLSRITTIRWFKIDSTNVSSVPPWVREWVEQDLQRHWIGASRTPWCTDVVLQTNSSEKAAHPWLTRVGCDDEGPYGVYPLYVDERANEVW